MVWDYAELNPFGESVGDVSTAVDLVASAIEFLSDSSTDSQPRAIQRDARHQSETEINILVTDPPYYDSINYADISDFFYVWLKRSARISASGVAFLSPDAKKRPGSYECLCQWRESS